MDDWQYTPSSSILSIIVIILIIVVVIIIIVIAVNSGNNNNGDPPSNKNNNQNSNSNNNNSNNNNSDYGSNKFNHNQNSFNSSQNTIKPVSHIDSPKSNRDPQNTGHYSNFTGNSPNSQVDVVIPDLSNYSPNHGRIIDNQFGNVQNVGVIENEHKQQEINNHKETAGSSFITDLPTSIQSDKSQYVEDIAIDQQLASVEEILLPRNNSMRIDSSVGDSKSHHYVSGGSDDNFDLHNEINHIQYDHGKSTSKLIIEGDASNIGSKNYESHNIDSLGLNSMPMNSTESVPINSINSMPINPVPINLNNPVNQTNPINANSSVINNKNDQIRPIIPQLPRVTPYIPPITGIVSKNMIIDETSGLSIDPSVSNIASFSSDFSSQTEKSGHGHRNRNHRNRSNSNPFDEIRNLNIGKGKGQRMGPFNV